MRRFHHESPFFFPLLATFLGLHSGVTVIEIVDASINHSGMTIFPTIFHAIFVKGVLGGISLDTRTLSDHPLLTKVVQHFVGSGRASSHGRTRRHSHGGSNPSRYGKRRRRVVRPMTLANELLETLDVGSGHFHFDVVVACATGPEWHCFGRVGKEVEERFSVVEWDDFVVSTMDDVDGTRQILHPIHIWKQISNGSKADV
mmetsp:Transcript_5295/g.10349  ORF Transcript_5295/g.10349 Transcript_5295/m.10349 type:complete len:201 (-) Transcript_5295:366-968(-)